MGYATQPLHLQFADLNGDPLEDGYLYFGTVNLNPITNPITVYWDAALTQPAAQPIRTLNGYPVRNGKIADVFCAVNYSQTVLDKNSRLVYSEQTSANTFYGFMISLASSIGSSLIGFIQAGVGAVARILQDKVRERVSLFDFMTAAQITAFKNGTYNAGVETAIQACFTYADAASAPGINIKWPAGNPIIKTTLVLPRSARITGETRRGLGNPPAVIGGSGLFADFAGPAFTAAPGVLTSYDTTLEYLNVRGDKATYPAGNGITITNVADITLKNMVVSNFGTNNISTNGNYATLENVYSAQAGTANFNIDGSFNKVLNCQSDGGQYGLYSTVNATDLVLDNGCWMEGATVAGFRIGGQRTTIDNTGANQTVGGKGLISAAERLHLGPGFKALGEGTAASTIGIDLSNKIEFSLMGPLSSGFAIALEAAEGAGNIIGGQYEGTVTGMRITGGSFWAQIIGAFISGPTNSLLHVSGSRVQYFANRFDDSTGVYKAPTISAGTPIIIGADATNLKLTSGTLDTQSVAVLLGGGGGTGVVSVGAVDTAGAGFRLVRIPN